MPSEDIETRLTRFEDLDRTSQVFEAATGRTGPATATSPEGSVTVALDGDGALTSITVRGDWEQETDASALGALILMTLVEAESQRLKSFFDATGEEIDQPRRPRPLPRLEIDAGAFRGHRGDESLRAAVDAVGGLRGMVTDLKEAMLEAARAEHHGRSDGGHARATCNGQGHLTGLDLDERWLPSAHPHNIGREARDAIIHAKRAAATRSLQSVIDESRVGRLQRMLTNAAPPNPSQERNPS